MIDFKDETFVNVSASESPVINAMLKQGVKRPVPKIFDAADVNEQTLYLESGKGVAVAASTTLHLTLV